MSRFYLTTAIDYVNSRPHLGTAYEKVAADVIARYKRLCGFDTRFLMGNDEHSQNVFKKATEVGQLNTTQTAWKARDLAEAGHLVRRLHPHDGAPTQSGRDRLGHADSRGRGHLRRRL